MARSRETPENRTVLHAFADHGIESEVFPDHWTVVRLGIDPTDGYNDSEPIKADANHPPFKLDTQFNLALLHPECARWSSVTSISGDPKEHPNQIPLARTIGRAYADHYIIENVPKAELHDPVVMNGYMFGLPIKYERAFETSFPIVDDLPTEEDRVQECSSYFSSDRSLEWWLAAKGYTGEYRKRDFVKGCVPADYIRFLVRQYLKAVNDRDATEARGSH